MNEGSVTMSYGCLLDVIQHHEIKTNFHCQANCEFIVFFNFFYTKEILLKKKEENYFSLTRREAPGK